MFASRQFEEISPLIEISRTGTVAPGAITTATAVGVSVACTVGTLPSGGASPATFALGDQLEVFPPAGAAINGVIVSASPTATPGTCELVFQNNTGGTITPVSSVGYVIVATRIAGNVM